MVVPSIAHAHVGIGETSGFTHGVSHPLTGIDHLCAMIAVGLWAAQTGGRAIWAVPLAFVSVMLLGGASGMTGVHFPLAETGIALSVLMLGCSLQRRCGSDYWPAFLSSGCLRYATGMPTVPKCLRRHPRSGMQEVSRSRPPCVTLLVLVWAWESRKLPQPSSSGLPAAPLASVVLVYGLAEAFTTAPREIRRGSQYEVAVLFVLLLSAREA